MRDLINIVESMSRTDRLIEKTSPPRILVMVHGTDVYNAQRIMQEGFVAKPEWKSYSEGEDPFLESLDGAYFAESLATAIKYASRTAQEGDGVLAIIEAEVDLNEAVPDEDMITNAIQRSASSSPDGFVRNFHYHLDPAFKVQPPAGLLKKLKQAFARAQSYEDEDMSHYREILDQVCRAYAHVVLEPHPAHVHGRNVRLPNGLPPENIISVTTFMLDEDYTVMDVEAMKGKPIDENRLQDAVDQLCEEGLLG